MTDEQIKRHVVKARNSDLIQKTVSRGGLLVSQSIILPGLDSSFFFFFLTKRGGEEEKQ